MSNGILPMPFTAVHSALAGVILSGQTGAGVTADKVTCRDLSLAVRATRVNRTGSVDNRNDVVVTAIFIPDTDYAAQIGVDGTFIQTYPKITPASASGAIHTFANAELYLVGDTTLEDVDGQEEVTIELTFMLNSDAVITAEA